MIKLHAVVDGPPSVAVRMLLQYLKVQYEFVKLNYFEGELFREDFYKVIFDFTLK